MRHPRLVIAALALVGSCAFLLLGAGELLSRAATRSIDPPPADFAVQTVRIPTAAGQSVAGWFASGVTEGGAVLLLHGIRADRTQMLARARSLNRMGYAVLLIDLPAHGESTGDRITFGAREALGVTAAVGYLRHRLPRERLGIIGVSLGAASAVMAEIKPATDAIVLESMYPAIEEAVANRLSMKLGSLGAQLAPLLLWQLPLRTGIGAENLRPIRHMAGLGSPVLVASGADDKHTTWGETERLFAAARSPRELWRVEGAAHVDLHAFNPPEYERRVFSFLAKHLRAKG